MSAETIKKIDKKIKVNIHELNKKIILKEKKQKLHSRIIYLSLLVSVGLIGYFAS